MPAKDNAEFVCAMEDVLAVYKRSYDETHPLIGMDESSKQHIKEVRQPIPAKPGTVGRTKFVTWSICTILMLNVLRGLWII